MKKNYYEILEVDKNASFEVIEKAYKILIKKYHPDLQEDNNKQKYEELVKLLNEAYEVLSDQEKRNQYDLELENENIEDPEIINTNNSNYYDENINTVENNNNNNTNINNSYNSTNSQKINYDEQLNNAINKAYYDAYVQNLKNMGYSIKYKKTFKDYLIIFFTIIVTLIILFIIFQIPFVKNHFLDLYEQNSAFKLIIDIFKSIINVFINILKRDS